MLAIGNIEPVTKDSAKQSLLGKISIFARLESNPLLKSETVVNAFSWTRRKQKGVDLYRGVICYEIHSVFTLKRALLIL